MATEWRPAKCLPVLRAQLDKAYPGRKTTLDYYLGDAAHAARQSDHNPDKDGVVHAYDITNSPPIMLSRAVAEALAASRDPRISYLISDRRMLRSYPHPGTTPWEWAPYTGESPHTEHSHLSVVSDPRLCDDVRPWDIKGIPMPKPAPLKFRSMIPGGYFSSTPFDTRINTSIRTNNPGAINDSAAWVRAYPGYAGGKVTSMSGSSPNSTAIFETPEQGVACYYELLKRYRAAGAKTIEQIIIRYGGSGQVQKYQEYVKFVVSRTGLPSTTEIKLSGDDETLIKFAKAMWRYEAGKETPLSDAQIVYGIKLGRNAGKLVGFGAPGAIAVVGAVVAQQTHAASAPWWLIGSVIGGAIVLALGTWIAIRWWKDRDV